MSALKLVIDKKLLCPLPMLPDLPNILLHATSTLLSSRNTPFLDPRSLRIQRLRAPTAPHHSHLLHIRVHHTARQIPLPHLTLPSCLCTPPTIGQRQNTHILGYSQDSSCPSSQVKTIAQRVHDIPRHHHLSYSTTSGTRVLRL